LIATIYFANQEVHRQQIAAHRADDEKKRAEEEKRRTDEAARRIAIELSASRIEQGRLLASEGDARAAEDALWPEYFQHPDAKAVRTALWELHTQPGYLRTLPSKRECRTRVLRADGVLSCSGDDTGILRISHSAAGRTPLAIKSGLKSVLSIDVS